MSSGEDRPRIAVFAGPTATILNTHPLRTSAKARAKYGLSGSDLERAGFDPLRPQRLARPAVVYVEQFSGHPLEADAAEHYAPPDGFVDADGSFSAVRRAPTDRPVYEIELRPEDGLYLLPFMGRRSDGAAWDASEGTGEGAARQTFYPDAARLFEEIDRFELGPGGENNQLSRRARFDHFRAAPSGGYTLGCPGDRRTDRGEGDLPPERSGVDFFPYWPPARRREPLAGTLAELTNSVRQVLATGEYAGALWLEGSPFVEETTYWLNLLVDCEVPIVGCAGSIGSTGRANVVDAVSYLLSRIWADADGRDRVGAVVVQDEQVFTAREVQKADDRPGGYVATGGHGGVVATIGKPGPPVLTFLPARAHTWRSAVRFSELPATVSGLRWTGDRIAGTTVEVLDGEGRLAAAAMPAVRIVKHARYQQRADGVDDTVEVEIAERIRSALDAGPLVGFVFEAGTPYGDLTAPLEEHLHTLALRGVPFVKVGRGDVGGFVPKERVPVGIAGGNLTATKARLLLMACLLRFGSLPPAEDPASPTAAEVEAVRRRMDDYQRVFDGH